MMSGRQLLMLSVLGALLALPIARVLHIIFGEPEAYLLVLICLVAVIEAAISEGFVRTRSLDGGQLVRFRTLELALAFVVIKLATLWGESGVELMAELGRWPTAPWRILDFETGAAMGLFLAFWRATTETLRDLERVGEPDRGVESTIGRTGALYTPPFDSLAARFLRAGGIIVVAGAIVAVGVERLLDLRRPFAPDLSPAVLGFFVLGFLALAQVRLVAYRKDWRSRGAHLDPDLVSRWRRSAAGLILLAFLAALLMPTRDTIALVEGTKAVLRLITWVFQAFRQRLDSWPFVRPEAGRSVAPPFPTSDQELPEPSPSIPGIDEPTLALPHWLPELWGVAFWILMSGMVLYVVVSYLRDRPNLLRGLLGRKLTRPLSRGLDVPHLLRRLLRAISGIWRGFRSVMVIGTQRWWPTALTAERRGLKRQPPPSERTQRTDAARQQVLVTYLRVLRRAEKAGIPREPGETPSDYLAELENQIPAIHRPMAGLTALFLEARFSRHRIESEQARAARTHGSEATQALRSFAHRQGPIVLPSRESPL